MTTADPLAEYAAAAWTGTGTDIARGLRVLAAQLDAGRAACAAIAAAGHRPARHHRCRGCRALADAEVAGLWTTDPKETT